MHSRVRRRGISLTVCGLALLLPAAIAGCRKESTGCSTLGVKAEPSFEIGPGSPPEVASESPPEVASESPPEVASESPPEVAPESPAEVTLLPPEPEIEPVATNPLGGCGLCHVDVEDAMVGSLHLTEGVGCVKCHGPSKEHAADENNEVLPDRTFAREEIDHFCEECHECSRPKDCPVKTKTDAQRKVCTECHGAHKLVLAKEKGEGADTN